MDRKLFRRSGKLFHREPIGPKIGSQRCERRMVVHESVVGRQVRHFWSAFEGVKQTYLAARTSNKMGLPSRGATGVDLSAAGRDMS